LGFGPALEALDALDSRYPIFQAAPAAQRSTHGRDESHRRASVPAAGHPDPARCRRRGESGPRTRS
jgi:hypothetical protein